MPCCYHGIGNGDKNVMHGAGLDVEVGKPRPRKRTAPASPRLAFHNFKITR